MPGFSEPRLRASAIAVLLLTMLFVTSCSSATEPAPTTITASPPLSTVSSSPSASPSASASPTSPTTIAATTAAPSSTESGGNKGLPTTGAGPETTTNPYQEVETGLKDMIDAQAQWLAPPAVDVGTTTTIGLKIGNSPEVRDAIERRLPDTPAEEAGTVRIGPNVLAHLDWNEAQADIQPRDRIVSSSSDEVGLLFTWNVTPKVPGELHVIATIEVSMSNGSVPVTTQLDKTLTVKRTLGYTLHQVFTNWATWSAIVVALLAAFRRTRELVLKPFRRRA